MAGGEDIFVHMGAGIRQGCPLSLLLFATVLDPFLRLLTKNIENGMATAYADDIALVMRSSRHNWAAITGLFSGFALVSGLSMNLSKTICVPLVLGDIRTMERKLSEMYPFWTGVRVEKQAQYLGYILGPGA